MHQFLVQSFTILYHLTALFTAKFYITFIHIISHHSPGPHQRYSSYILSDYLPTSNAMKAKIAYRLQDLNLIIN